MRSRRPAEPHFSTRPTGAVARSPAERLEPTRPLARQRRRYSDREPGEGRPVVRVLSGLFTLILLMMLLAGGIAFYFDRQIDAPGPLAAGKVVVIPKGEGTHEIATRLEREGVVADRRLFIAGYLWTRFAGWMESAKPAPLRAGEYQMVQAMSVRQVIDLLSEGRTVTYKVTVPEGLTSYQIVERLKADPNLSGDIAVVPAEGTLLPETFVVERGTPRQTIIERMQAEWRKVVDRAWAQRRKDLPLKSIEEAVILASIVEKETARGDERARVAAVFVNRLRQNMRLQSDPTILYGLTGGKTLWSRPILRSEIVQKTAHNTYQIDGLPPTPICNPGKAAIEATLNPADTKDLYFVADGTGAHVFAETLKEHNANVQKWRAVEKELKAKASAPADDTPVTAPSGSGTRAVVRRPPPKAQAAPEKGKAQQPAAQPDKGKASTPGAATAGKQEILPWVTTMPKQ